MQYLVYVNRVGINSDNNFTYEFYFSEETLGVWGIDWEIKPSYSANISVLEQRNYDSIEILKTELVFDLAQKSTSTSLQDMKDSIIPVAWECIDGYDIYPEAGRLVFPFGISKQDVEIKLAKRDIAFENAIKSDGFGF